jgi:hypothetical protein
MTIHVARHNGSNCPLELHGEGIVLRVEPGKATQPSQRSSGFAASVHFYSESSKFRIVERLRRPDQDTAEP